MSIPVDPKPGLSTIASSNPEYTLSSEDRIIFVIGPTDAGKSTFIDHATNKNGETIEHGVKSLGIRAVRVKHPKDQGFVVFVDTPDFDDTNRREILGQIASWYIKACKEKVFISAIVYLHRISDKRKSGSLLDNLQEFSEMCEQEMPRVVLATTAWSEAKSKSAAQQDEKNLKKTFWADVIKKGCTVQRFGDSNSSAWKMIGSLPTVKQNVILSREIYDKTISNGTPAGEPPRHPKSSQADPKSKPPAKSLSTQGDPTYKLSADDRIVVVMGPTGAGKSTFIEYATQQSGGTIGHSLQSETSAIRAVRTKHPDDQGSVIFVDTPGFDDTHRSDIEILAQIAGWFVKVYKEKVPLSAIIYLHRISDNRMAGSPLKNLQMFASMCGQNAMPRVTLGTTMWSETMPETGARREKELKTTFWADMIKEGCNVQRFTDSYESAWIIVGTLPTEQENVILSREILDDKKNLNETAAGVKLTEELNRLIADQKEAARRMEEQANSHDNPVLVAELQLRHDEIEKKIGGVAAQLQLLKIPIGRKIINFLTGKNARKSGVYVPGNR